ncbi:MAG: SH3 domain-containing C40 family peptidase [Lachnospiraceae bacterium]
MRKGVTKVAACCIVSALAMTSFPAVSVDASSFFSSILPAAGGALATGEGVSVRDIKAGIARSAAKQTAAATHSVITGTNGTSGAALQIGASSVVNIPEKAETPASKAVSESATVNGTSVVGSASEGAPIAVTTNVEAATAASAPAAATESISENSAEKSAPNATVSQNGVSQNEVPSIEIKPEAADVAEGEEDLSGTIIAQVSNYVNVRATASEEGEVVGKLYNNSAGEWLGKEGDWYKIKSGNVVGYVKGEYVVTGQAAIELAAKVGHRVAVVATTTLKVREEPSIDAAVLGLVPNEDRLTVLEETDEWLKVSIEEGDGYVSKEFVSVSTEFVQAESTAEEEARLKKEDDDRKKANAAAAQAQKKNSSSSSSSSGKSSSYSAAGSGTGSSVANYALQFVGNPYVYGGTSLTNGTDCSGFTMGVYKNFGVSLPHSSGAQRSMGYDVGGIQNAQPGDLVCYSGHVAMYIGNGQIVHASTAATGIKISNASYRQILAVRRIF